MNVIFSDSADEAERSLSNHDADKLWDVLDRITQDPESAPQAPWARHVSSHRVWGTHIPGTEHTVYWRIEGRALYIIGLYHESAG